MFFAALFGLLYYFSDYLKTSKMPPPKKKTRLKQKVLKFPSSRPRPGNDETIESGLSNGTPPHTETVHCDEDDTVEEEPVLEKYKKRSWVSELLPYYKLLSVESMEKQCDGSKTKIKMCCLACQNNEINPQEIIIAYKAAGNFIRHLEVIEVNIRGCLRTKLKTF